MKKDIKNVVFTFGLVCTMVVVSSTWYHRGVTMTENALAARGEYQQQEQIAQLEMQRLLLTTDIETVTRPRETVAVVVDAIADTNQAATSVAALAANDTAPSDKTNPGTPAKQTKPTAVVAKSPVSVTTPAKQSDTSAAQKAAQAKAAQEAALAKQIAAAKAATQKKSVALAAKQVQTSQTATAKKVRQSRAS